MIRKTIAVDEDTYRELVKAKAQLELKSEKNLTLGQAIGAIAIGALAGYGLAKMAEYLVKDEDEE